MATGGGVWVAIGVLDAASQHALNAEFTAAIEAQCDSAGKVEYSDLLYLVTAAAA